MEGILLRKIRRSHQISTMWVYKSIIVSFETDFRNTFFVFAFPLFLLLILSGAAKAQTITPIAPAFDQHRIVRPDTSLQLSHRIILPNSETVYLDSIKLYRVSRTTQLIMQPARFIYLFNEGWILNHTNILSLYFTIFYPFHFKLFIDIKMF